MRLRRERESEEGGGGRRRKHLAALGSLLVGDGLLFAHGGDNGDEEVLAIVKGSSDFLSDLSLIRNLNVVLGNTIAVHQVEEIVVDVDQLVFSTGDVGDIHVVGGGGDIFQFLASEDIDGDQVDLGVTVLASLGGGHVNDLARTALDDDVSVFAQSRALGGVGEGGTGTCLLELVLMSLVVRHFVEEKVGGRRRVTVGGWW